MKAKIKKVQMSGFKVIGFAPPVPAKVIGKCLTDIYVKHDYKLTAEDVVSVAKSPKHPLHPCFEWNDTKASKQWRLHQARQLIRCVNIKQEVKGKVVVVRAFVNIKEDSKGNLTHNPLANGRSSHYVSIGNVMSDNTLKKYTIDIALIEINRWMDKYKTLKTLLPMMKDIKKHSRKLAA